MPHYVQDPDNPGQHIDVIDLVKRNRSTPPPEGVLSLMRCDSWTRHEALLILAGYSPQTVLDDARHPVNKIYLDGTSDRTLAAATLQHPIGDEILGSFWTLESYSQGEPMDERRSPDDWLSWAIEKGFTPYWLEYWRRHERTGQTPKGETEIGGEVLLDWDEALEKDWNGGAIAYQEWIKSAPDYTLTAGEAARLMSGLDPKRFQDLKRSGFGYEKRAGRARDRAEDFERLASSRLPPKERDTPAGWLAWADSLQQKVHSPFRAAVERLWAEQGKRVVDSNTAGGAARAKRMLDAEIEAAKRGATDASDYHAVWEALKKLALDETGPFTGYVDKKEGLQYENGKGKQVYFSKDALRKRMRREAQ